MALLVRKGATPNGSKRSPGEIDEEPVEPGPGPGGPQLVEARNGR